MKNLFLGLQRFLEEERDLFGEAVLVDAQGPGGESMTTRKAAGLRKKAAHEGSLFETERTREPWEDARSLSQLESLIHDCRKCDLWKTRGKLVFGDGNPRATLMLVGEAPGADEDAQGKPFVGRAGQLLNKILEAINFTRDEVYICNILKSRPPGNRTPLPEEVEACLPYLKKQIALVRPRLIVCLGLTAAQNLLGTTESLGKLRGRTLDFEGTPVRVTYHPAALLRNPGWKRATWEDVQAARKLHDELVSSA